MPNPSSPLSQVALPVAVLALVVSGLALFQGVEVRPETNLAAAGGNKVQSSSNSGSVWEDLKAKGLQGEHYTLNIHGKKSSFNKSDCTVVPDPVTGEYSNNIFVPSVSEGATKNQIVMSSGNAKGKWASTANTTYGVRDACTAPFDGDAAELTLPPNEKGYYVAARVLGKPTYNPELKLEGDLVWVIDESGNDLLVLGLVTDNGFETPTQTLTRTKGKVTATDITGLFEWSGAVCYFNGENYCYDSAGAYMCVDRSSCCIDSDGNGTLDSCEAPTIDPDTGTQYCPVAGYALLALSCRDYVNEWVFNIGDFVGYMWDTYTDGEFKLVNIRFYPVR